MPTGLPIGREAPVHGLGTEQPLFPADGRAPGLDDDLVQHALGKTLTAKDLAEHLNPSAATNLAQQSTPSGPQLPGTTTAMPLEQQTAYEPGNRGVPPPGIDPHMQMYNQMAYMQSQMPQPIPPSGPRAMLDSQAMFPPHHPSGPPARHAKTPSFDSPRSANRIGRGRRASVKARPHAKRYDQGPVPSNADIYPEDAVPPPPMTPSGNFYSDRSVQWAADLRVEDAFVWPTPAEALKGAWSDAAAPPGAYLHSPTRADGPSTHARHGQESV